MTPASTPFVAVDWGTTNRRIYAIGDDGAVESVERDECGVAEMRNRDWTAEVDAIAQRFGGRPIVCAGMAGSNIGWRDVGYVAAPVDLSGLAGAIACIAPDRLIVPGIRHAAHELPDVMRGEEIQVLGAVAARLLPETARVCLPGTHCKWVTLEQGRITGFRTSMTGELFALLRDYSLLAPQFAGPAIDGIAFTNGVREACRGDLLGSLFGIRARALLRQAGDDDAASFASGLLIGTDVAAQLRVVPEGRIYVVGEKGLAHLYCSAITALGASAEPVDCHAAFVAGIAAIWARKP